MAGRPVVRLVCESEAPWSVGRREHGSVGQPLVPARGYGYQMPCGRTQGWMDWISPCSAVRGKTLLSEGTAQSIECRYPPLIQGETRHVMTIRRQICP